MNRVFKRAFSMSANRLNKYEHLKVSFPTTYVAHVELNRPEKKNALNGKLWEEIGDVFKEMNSSPDCRAIVLSASGTMFCSGIDLQDLMAVGALVQDTNMDTARKAFRLRATIRRFQDSFTALEKCNKPVIAAIHGGCIGGATSLISGADVRYASEDAYFQIKEVELGLTADVGVLQRWTKVVNNQSLYRELVFTARRFSAEEAQRLGVVSRIFSNREELLAGALHLAESIASKSPVAVQGSKVQMNFARDNKADDALEYMATWNMAMLQTEDIFKAATAVVTKSKEPIEYSKL
jgi:delta(3,5)-delta(2,4)-dienoyl-CoA isomerase